MDSRQTFNQEMCSWINVDATQPHEIKKLRASYAISDEMLTYALDDNERARVEYDPMEKALLLIFNVPNLLKKDNHYETSPMAFILKDHTFFSFVNDRTSYVENIIENILSNEPNQSTASLLFHTLFLISDYYFPLVEEVDSQRIHLNKKLREKTTNKNLFATISPVVAMKIGSIQQMIAQMPHKQVTGIVTMKRFRKELISSYFA